MAHRTRTDSIPTVAAATVAATVAGALTAVAVPGSALAQDQAADQAADGGMEEMVVTATRRETNLLDTPVAVTAVSQETLVLRNITNVLEIEKLVPNLKVQDQRTLGMGAVQFSMRGVGNTNFTEQGDPNVGFHVDGVYLPRPQAAIALLYDLERVEVLRGPQGTLFGRNSTVGTINVVTAKPQFEEFSGSIEGQYGRFNDQLVRGTLNIPILDNLAVRLTGIVHRRDSYYDLEADDVLFDDEGFVFPDNPYLVFGNPTDEDNGAGAIDERGYRVAVEWEPIENLRLAAVYEEFSNESPAAPLTVRDDPYTAFLDLAHTLDQNTQGLRTFASYQFEDLFEIHYTYGDTDFRQTATVDLDAGVHRFRPSVITNAEEDLFFFDNPWTNDSRSHEVQLRSAWGGPVEVLAGYFNFREETLRNLWIDIPQAAGGVILFNQPQRIAKSEAFFGEISWDITEQWEIRGGVRHSDDRKIDVDGSRSDAFPGVGGLPFGCPVLAIQAGITPEEARATNFCGINSVEQQFAPPFTSFDRVFNNDESFNSTDWSVTVSYTPDDDSLYYVNVATGYKSGGFQDTFFLPRTGEVFFPVLEPEDLISYEVGVKKTLLDGALSIAADVYFLDYENKQEGILVDFGDLFCPFTFGDFNQDGFIEDFDGDGVFDEAPFGDAPFNFTQFDPDTGELTVTDAQLAICQSANFDLADFPINRVELVPLNISDATTGGIEIEWLWNLTDNDRFDGFITVIYHNRIGDVDTSQLPLVLTDSLACNDRVGGCPSVDTIRGNELPFAPTFTMSANYSRDFHMKEGGVITAGAGLNVSTGYFLSIWNVDCYTSVSTGQEVCDNGDKQDAYATLDLNLRYTAPAGNWFVEAYGTNVTGTTFATFNRRNSADDVTGYAFNARTQYGLRAGFSFGG